MGERGVAVGSDAASVGVAVAPPETSGGAVAYVAIVASEEGLPDRKERKDGVLADCPPSHIHAS